MSLPDTAPLSQGGGSGVDEGNQMSLASSDLQLSHPTSPQTINHFHIINSNLNGFTIHSGTGSRNSGGRY